MERWKLGRIFRSIADTCMELGMNCVDACWIAQHCVNTIENL